MFAFMVVLLGVIAFVLIRGQGLGRPCPAGLRGRIRTCGWGLLLMPAALMAAAMAGHLRALAVAEVTVAAALVLAAPRLAAKLAPYAVLALGLKGLVLAVKYQQGYTSAVLYGVVPASGWETWRDHLVLPEALLFTAFGLWLLLKVNAPGAGMLRPLLARWLDPVRGRISPRLGLLLIPVTVMIELLLGPRYWFGLPKSEISTIVLIDAAIATASLVLVFRSRAWAATVATAGLLVLGVYGLAIAAFWPNVPGFVYGLQPLASSNGALWGALQGTALVGLGLWLAPRVLREHRDSIELAERASQLTQRVETLTQTRSAAVDTAAAELRRIERDLHDGAQARMVAVGMSLQAAERLFTSNPQAALALVGEAKESSSRALTELRDLVRGIYPPVLADRGLGDAIQALGLDTPLPVTVDADLPGPIELPVASAVYFSVAEALANTTKHADARSVHISLSHRGGMLRAEVTDDGAGGADPGHGTGLAGVERRLATFDGILAVSSPPGGPTIIVIEVPCASSSAKTSSC
jgi:signal transduction histidine kinase